MKRILAATVLIAGGLSFSGPILAQQVVDQKADEAEKERILERIASFRKLEIDKEEVWGAAIRDLVKIGKPAVLPLIEELDRTTEDRPLRAIGFTLRAIGDPRAVPALIRAIPRTLVKGGSDYGLRAKNAELLAFLQKHEHQKNTQADLFTFGMPFREIFGALHSLTGQQFGEAQLNFINLEGGERERRLKRQLFLKMAWRWSSWWEENWKKYTDDPAFSKVGLPPIDEIPDAAQMSPQPFPTGAKVKESSAQANVIIGPPQPLDYYTTFKDLDTGRDSKWPGELGDSKTAKPEALSAWAVWEGFDLHAVEYRPPGSEKSFYALQGMGLRAWQVDNGLFSKIVSELQAGRVPDLGRPVGEYLMDRDPATGAYRPEEEATFLFSTAEGTTGILQITGQITELFGKDDIGKPVKLRTNRGFYRGVQIMYKLIYEEDK